MAGGRKRWAAQSRRSLMDRRAFIGSLALGTLAGPRVAPAQPMRKVYRIGILPSSLRSWAAAQRGRQPTATAQRAARIR